MSARAFIGFVMYLLFHDAWELNEDYFVEAVSGSEAVDVHASIIQISIIEIE
jgi:hypothetical protein